MYEVLSHRVTRQVTVVGCALMFAFAGVQASPITFAYEATVTSSVSGNIGGSVDETLHIEHTFESTTPDVDPSPTLGVRLARSKKPRP